MVIKISLEAQPPMKRKAFTSAMFKAAKRSINRTLVHTRAESAKAIRNEKSFTSCSICSIKRLIKIVRAKQNRLSQLVGVFSVANVRWPLALYPTRKKTIKKVPKGSRTQRKYAGVKVKTDKNKGFEFIQGAFKARFGRHKAIARRVKDTRLPIQELFYNEVAPDFERIYPKIKDDAEIFLNKNFRSDFEFFIKQSK